MSCSWAKSGPAGKTSQERITGTEGPRTFSRSEVEEGGDHRHPLIPIWIRIRDELAYLQDLASAEFPGAVINPIYGSVFCRDTAFAALVFATEFRRTQNEKWRNRATAALGSLKDNHAYRGVEEPVWNRFGWHCKKGSLAATGMLLDAVWEAQKLIDKKSCQWNDWRDLCSYLATCRVAPGLFAHDALQAGTHPPAVQNTTAIALYLLEYMAQEVGGSFASILQERDRIYAALRKGQRPDGFWPYVFPGTAQQIYFRSPMVGRVFLRELPFLRKLFCPEGDRSIFFGDLVHHCLVVYYLAKSLSLCGKIDHFRDCLKRGWTWILAQMREASEGGLRLDFASEPIPRGPRYCNFRETTSYFLILASLPLLSKLEILSGEEAQIASKLLTYVQANLLEKEGTHPAIKPYEGPPEVLRYILPRVGESVAWKGGCLSALVLEYCRSSAF